MAPMQDRICSAAKVFEAVAWNKWILYINLFEYIGMAGMNHIDFQDFSSPLTWCSLTSFVEKWHAYHKYVPVERLLSLGTSVVPVLHLLLRQIIL